MSIGHAAPNFNYIDKNGQSLSLHSLVGLKVIFFFPKAFTPGCTKESCSFQSHYVELKELGVTEIFGISLDSPEQQSNFAEKYGLEYQFVSDRKGDISKSYGVYRNRILFKYADRDTFIVDDHNKIVDVLHNGVTGKSSAYGLKKHGIEVIEVVKRIQSN
ncbi:MAG: peroxiredoxin [Candidatus Kariarchaeaceae archaeon]